jgi:hypothetical protein
MVLGAIVLALLQAFKAQGNEALAAGRVQEAEELFGKVKHSHSVAA